MVKALVAGGAVFVMITGITDLLIFLVKAPPKVSYFPRWYHKASLFVMLFMMVMYLLRNPIV